MRLGEVVEDVSMLEVSLVLERMLAGGQEIDRWIDTVIYISTVIYIDIYQNYCCLYIYMTGPGSASR